MYVFHSYAAYALMFHEYWVFFCITMFDYCAASNNTSDELYEILYFLLISQAIKILS